MVFSSSIFLFGFLPLFLLVYYLVPIRFKNLAAIIGSIIFYIWGAPIFILVIFASIICDFLFAKLIFASKGQKRKIILGIAITVNVSILLYFKYANFFVENFNTLMIDFGLKPMKWMEIALPIGISFFTFHEMSYLIDVYRGVKPPMKNILNYSLYILYFPQLIAGPIIRFNEISDQIEERSYQYTLDNRLYGLYRFITGLAKKVLIANVLGDKADAIFALSGNDLTTGLAWIGVLAYAFQIYFDFSGYSDMAIGIARMMGFVFPENFNNPYISQSITEFWRRWHMSLSRWMKDYLYISLGGNKVSAGRMYFNLCFVFVISGFWHGAEWNFVAWGAYHGLFLIADRLFLLKILKKLGKYPSIILTFFFTLIGWVLFRGENMNHIGVYLAKMFSFHTGITHVNFTEDFWITLAIAVFFSFFCTPKFGQKLHDLFFGYQYGFKSKVFLGIVFVFLFILSVAFITSSGFNPFIYFRF